MAEPVRIFVVDDHAIVRAGVAMLLRAQDGFEVVGEARSGEDALERVVDAAPQVVLLDLSLPGIGGIDTARRLREVLPEVRLVALSMHEDPEYVQGFLEAGGSGYVPKSSVQAELVDAIRAVVRGEYHVPARLLADLAREMANHDGAVRVKLTGREHEVVTRIAHGSTYREIAAELGISEKTVATYRERASEKLGVRTRAELVRWAIENGLLD
ncbi:MAG: response regulator transcription factor [Trueperaceae bacterium]